jgi:hypothetical protein
MGFPYDGNAERLFHAIDASFERWRPAASVKRVLPRHKIHHVKVDLVLGVGALLAMAGDLAFQEREAFCRK